MRFLIPALLLLSVPAFADPVTVCFTPAEHCAPLILAELAAAKTSVRVAAYSFTSVPIAKALIAAMTRGVDVQVELDRSNETARHSAAGLLLRAKVPVTFDSRHPIAHAKVMVVDGAVVLTGSYNYSAGAEHNSENLLILRDRELAGRYLANWEAHRVHCR